MSFGKYSLGLLILTMGISVYGKTLIEYKNEARLKTPSCERANQFAKNNSIPGKGFATEELSLEMNRLRNLCESELSANLSLEGKALEQAEIKYYQEKSRNGWMESFKKGNITEDELHEEGYNIDGTDRKPSWYESHYWNFKKDMSKRLEGIGSFLLWPITFISVLLGLFLISNPKGFTKMIFGIMSNIARLLIGKKTPNRD